LGGQLDGMPVPPDRLIAQLNDQVPDLKRFRCLDRPRPPENGFDARQQFLEGERLRQVIVRSGLQAFYPTVDVIERREHQDGRLPVPAPDFPQKLPTVDAGQHGVQDDQLVVGFRQAGQAHFPVQRHIGLEVVFPQAFLEVLGGPGLVLDNEKFLHACLPMAQTRFVLPYIV
jgi:hypothetical protein